MFTREVKLAQISVLVASLPFPYDVSLSSSLYIHANYAKKVVRFDSRKNVVPMTDVHISTAPEPLMDAAPYTLLYTAYVPSGYAFSGIRKSWVHAL